ncbi:MAG: pilus assembly protein CpaA [Kiloniellaceae bacterium]|nr:pilus assembly protein CpaA [Kiloniellaceae bacterium]
MNTFLLFDLFFWTYVALLVCAAVFDVCRFIIPNWISIGLVVLFTAAFFVHPVRVDVVSHLGAMGLVLVATLVMYRFKVIGGGDLKLFAAVGLWMGLDALPQFALWVAIIGGAFSLGLIVLRRLLTGVLVAQTVFGQVTLPRLLLPGERIPYGVAIAFGGIWLARQLPQLGLFA